MYCQKCGAPNAEGAVACTSCGEKISPPGSVTSVQPGIQSPNKTIVQQGSWQPSRPRTSGLAVASLILGILSFMLSLFGSLPGLILGIVALRKIGRSGGLLVGEGLAIAGIICSSITLLFLPIMAAILLPVFASAWERARAASCASNLKQLGLATIEYSQDFDEVLPPQSKWSDDLFPYLKSQAVYLCPDADASRSSYDFEQSLGGLPLSDIGDPWNQVSLFDGKGGWNASGGEQDVVPRHMGQQRANLAFADGHVKEVPAPALGQYLWSAPQPLSSHVHH